MKSTTLYFSILLILIIFVSLYFKASNRESFTANFDPSIINSNVPNGPLSNGGLIVILNNLSRQLSGIVINKINIVSSPQPVVQDPNVQTTSIKVPKGQAQLLLNGQQIPGIPTVAAMIRMLTDMIFVMTSNAQSIDINYTASM